MAKFLRSDDEDGSRARLLRSSIFALELSAAGSFPASSDENRARQGMRDLDWLGELGPRVFVQVLRTETVSMRASLALRGGFSTNFKSAQYRGLTFTPGIAYEKRRLMDEYLTLTARLSTQWASREMQSYFFEVTERDKTPERRTYTANAGYLGSSLTTALWYEPAPGEFLPGLT